MSFDPHNFVTEEPVEKTFTPFKPGVYPFRILEVNEFETSKAGNEMLPLKLEFHDGEETSTVYEYLVFTEKAAFKIHQFAKSIGIKVGTQMNWNDPDFIEWVKRQTGKAKLKIEKSPKGYENNKVEAFVYDTAHASPQALAKQDVEEDDIPF